METGSSMIVKLAQFSSLLIMGMALAGPAKAADPKDVYFHPVSSWSVKAAGAAGQGPARCVMGNEFNNGFFLQLTSASGAIETLSLNIRQPAFTPGQTMTAKVSVPGKTSASLPAKAFEPEVMVINMKGQNTLFDAMKSGSVLDIDLDGNVFRFYLTGLAASMPQFTRCQGVTAPAPIASAEPESQKPAAKIEPETKTAEKADEIPLPAPGETRDVEKVNNKVLDSDELMAEIADFAAPSAAPADPAAQKNDDAAPIPSAIIKEEETSVSGGTEEKSADIKADEAEEKQAEDKADDAPAITPPPEKITTSISSPKPIITTQKSKAEVDFTDRAMPEKHVESVPAIPPGMDQKMREMENKISLMSQENDQLNAELERTLKASEKERLEVSSENWNLEEATMRYNEAERQLARLGQQIQKERAQCTMEKKELEMMLFDPNVTDQAQLARLSSMEKQLEEAKNALESQRASYEEKIRQLQTRRTQ